MIVERDGRMKRETQTQAHERFIFQNIWPSSTCFGCGVANPEGLQIQSTWSEDERFVIARYRPNPKYNAGLENVMYGGTVASLIDCHSVWTAIAFAYRAEGVAMQPPLRIGYMTGELKVKYVKPTPLDQVLHLKAWVDGEVGRKTRVLCELGPEGGVTALGDVLCVRVA